MLDTIINFITGTILHSTLGIVLYWVPVVICLMGYLIDFKNFYEEDIANYQKDYYDPKLTIGGIFGRLIISFIPVCNLFIAFFRHVWRIIFCILDFCETVLNIPLIRHNPKPKDSMGS